MKPFPSNFGDEHVICYSPLDERHTFTGACRQVVAGQLMGAMAGLVICQSSESGGFYLFGCDEDWSVVTDTWHESLDDALHQAEFEYVGVSSTWTYLNAVPK